MTLLRLERTFVLLAIACMPLYLWSSGLPQIAHFLVMLAWFVRLLRGQASLPSNLVFQVLIILLFWVFFRQIIFSMSTQELHFLLPPAYLLFNILFLASIFFHLTKDDDGANSRRIAFSVAAGAGIAAAWLFITGFSLSGMAQDTDRAVGPFNNPNQLGFYGLCLGGYASIFLANRTIRLPFFIALFGVGAFMSILSLSKAAMISYVAYAFVFFRGRQFLMLLVVFVSALFIAPMLDLSDYYFVSRLQTVGQDADDSLAGRGYGLVGEMGVNVIWGFGEGYYQMLSNDEIHSTIGNIFISYGLVGLAIFLIFQVTLFSYSYRVNRSVSVSAFILLPYFLYGITHNGFRFSSVWLLFALFAFLKPSIKDGGGSNARNSWPAKL